ncbi:MAG: MFS transporter [Eubacteriales bacterium]
MFAILKISQIKQNISVGLSELFPALTHKNFRYFWFGQFVSLIGSWMQSAGQAWLVLQITNSAFKLGVLNAAQFLPTLLLSVFAGVIVDRFPKRKIAVITQTILMACAFVLAALIWTGNAQYRYILILALVLGLAQALDMPARQSMIIDFVGKKDLMNAIALNSAIFNGTRIIGPAIAGIIMATAGTGFAFFINGLSFIPIIIVLTRISTANIAGNIASGESVLSEASAGIKYIAKTPVLYITLMLSMILCVFSQNFNTLIPALAKNVLNQESMGYGFLMSAMGLGALFGALTLAVRNTGKPKYHVFLAGGGIMALFMLLIGFQHNYVLSALLLAVVGWGMVTFNANANSIIQINAPDKMRGRITSILMLAQGGMIPIGSIYAGYTAQRFGSSFAYRLSGIIGIIAVTVTSFYYYDLKRKESNKSSLQN